jgi:alpha-beta hydrolase superfamily lysophospholipase
MKLKNFIIAIFLCLTPTLSMGQVLNGYWKGAIASEEQGMKLIVEFLNDSSAKISYPGIGVSGMPVEQVRFSSPSVTVMVNDGSGQLQKFEGKAEGNDISGLWSGFGMQVPFFLKRTKQPAISYEEKNVSFKNGEVTLSGTVFLPKKDDKNIAVVIIHGSGAQTKDIYRFYAELFAQNGITTLIYDKRGCGASTGNWHEADFNTLAQDAVSAANELKKQNQKFKIGFLGFSQGGWIAPLAAVKFSGSAFVINVSAPAVSPREQEVAMVEQLFPALNFSLELMKETKDFIAKRTDFEKTGKNWNEYKQAKDSLDKKGVLDFIGAPDSENNWLWDFYRNVFDYNPVPALEKLNCPLLCIYGELDLLIPVERSEKITEEIFRKTKKTNYTVKKFKMANHAISYEPGKGGYQGFPKFADGYTELLISWMSGK